MRALSADDVAALVAIATEGGSPDADPAYLRFVDSHGRLLVADAEGEPAGFVAAIAIGETWMVTDLFVATRHRGRGIGSSLLDAVLDDAPQRMTFSSAHPAALAAYTRAGMTPQWRLLTMRRAHGGGTGAPPSAGIEWRHERAELVAYFRSRGALVAHDHVVLVAATHSVVLRAVGNHHEDVLVRALASLPADRPVDVSVPEHHPAAAWLIDEGFEVIDHDLFFAGPGAAVPPHWFVLHRGLC